MSIEEFATWTIKRFLSIIIMTVGVNDVFEVYFPSINSWHKGKMTLRLICFVTFAFICCMIYDLKAWEQYKHLLETFAMSMACVVFFFPIRGMSKPFIEGVLNRIAGIKKEE